MLKKVILFMLCWILTVGGLLIMMGQRDRSEALFYYFRLEDQVPEAHLLRLIVELGSLKQTFFIANFLTTKPGR